MGNVVAAGRRRRAVDTAPATIPKYKVLIVGGASVGKSSIFRSLLHTSDASSPSPVPSVGVNIGVKSVDVEGLGPMVVELWDIPAIAPLDKSSQKELYFNDTDGVLLVHSAANATSFDHVQSYHAAIMTTPSTASPSDVPAMLVLNNKSDTTADVAATHAEWLTTHSLAQLNVSAKLNVGLLAGLRRLLGEIASARTPQQATKPSDNTVM